jgi:signal transduction histidine kinase
VRHYLDLIDAGADEMDGLINALLSFSRFGQQALTRVTIDFERLCRDVFADLERESAGRRVELRIQALPPVSCDRVLLRQALSNLLSNALKFTRNRDSALIEIGCLPGSADPTPIFFVRDNGVGFDMRNAEKLFGVFQRLHHAHEFEGTGVGLATARRVIERHGGRIWAEALPDAGATFFFTLPPGQPKSD